MIETGKMNNLRISRFTDNGAYLIDEEGTEVLLPKRYVPQGAGMEDELSVFIYHDSDSRLTATTETPKAMLGDIAYMRVADTNGSGAFLDWGLMKDLFVPLSQQVSRMVPNQSYFVKVYMDEPTGRLAATERINKYVSNEELTVKEMEPVELLVYRTTDIGYEVIINNVHWGLLYYSDVHKEYEPGDKLQGYVKTIREDNKIDVMPGKAGYEKIADESEHILQLLRENDGYLPYHDKSTPEEISGFFGMSKKTFKVAVGKLYKQQLIELTKTGIKLAEEE